VSVAADVEYEVDLNTDPFSDFRPDGQGRRSLLQLMPLGDWAKVKNGKSRSTSLSAADNDLYEMIDGLDLPTEVAAVTYGGGCRIRRVRVPAPRTGGRTARTSRPVIVSKRALDEVRSETRD
jgi:hypothetical protein